MVEADDRGRILIPIEIRRRLGAKRFKVTERSGKIELEPVENLGALKGKYRSMIRAEWDELEEKGEGLVQSGQRRVTSDAPGRH